MCFARTGARRHGSGVLRMHLKANIRFVVALGLYLFGGLGVWEFGGLVLRMHVHANIWPLYAFATHAYAVLHARVALHACDSNPCVRSITIRQPQTSDPRPFQAIRGNSWL